MHHQIKSDGNITWKTCTVQYTIRLVKLMKSASLFVSKSQFRTSLFRRSHRIDSSINCVVTMRIPPQAAAYLGSQGIDTWSKLTSPNLRHTSRAERNFTPKRNAKMSNPLFRGLFVDRVNFIRAAFGSAETSIEASTDTMFNLSDNLCQFNPARFQESHFNECILAIVPKRDAELCDLPCVDQGAETYAPPAGSAIGQHTLDSVGYPGADGEEYRVG